MFTESRANNMDGDNRDRGSGEPNRFSICAKGNMIRKRKTVHKARRRTITKAVHKPVPGKGGKGGKN